MSNTRDHGGNLDAAIARFGGTRADWIDLSTGINPVPYPLPDMPAEAWTALPDATAQLRLTDAARAFWSAPDGAAILAVPGASAAIAHLPRLIPPARVSIPGPTYNEHAASFRAAGWAVTDASADIRVIVHPNNPTGACHPAPPEGRLTIIDESFCEVAPDLSHVALSDRNGVVVLKSFGKFWGLAGLRLGFLIARPEICAALAAMLGPWPVSGPALAIGAAALADRDWADATRARLADDAARLDALMVRAGAKVAGGTTLFRLYDVGNASAWQDRLARHRIWSRIFPYSDVWIRLGLPAAGDWSRIEAALS